MTTPPALPATRELLDLAAATRPDIDLDDLHKVIGEAWQAGWTWPQILAQVSRMLAQGGEPRDLRAAVRAPYGGRSP